MTDSTDDVDWYDNDEPESFYLKFEAIVRETEKAWLLKLDEKTEAWFPKSQCVIEDETGDQILVPEWLIDKNKLEKYIER